MVRAQAVRKNFGALQLLKGITLEVQPREVLCMVGTSSTSTSSRT
jgi:polar amino acid transport system ATP-binding protein